MNLLRKIRLFALAVTIASNSIICTAQHDLAKYLQKIDLPKRAFVIGNQLYNHHRPVPNAANDARLVSEKLVEIGFPPDQLIIDADQTTIYRRLDDFVDRELNSPDNVPAVVVLYYSGHGFAKGGGNFIVPIDAPLDTERLVETSISLDYIVERIGQGDVGILIVLTDSCRHNFFESIVDRDIQPFSRPKKRLEQAVFYGYSSEYGESSLSNYNQFDTSSPFATSLTTFLDQPGLDLVSFFKGISKEVYDATNYYQIPEYEDKTQGVFYIAPTDDYISDQGEKFSLSLLRGKDCVRRYARDYPAGPYYYSALRYLEETNDISSVCRKL